MTDLDIASRLRARVERTTADGIQRRHALLVGIDRCDDPAVQPLPYCVRDVQRLARTLVARGYEVEVLADDLGPERLPTLANVTRELLALVARGDEDDVLLVHFSCHGKLVGGRPHLLMRDTPASDSGIRRRGLALTRLLRILRGAPRWVAVFLDACHMGLGLDPETIAATRDVQARAGGFALLSGSTEGQVTQDSDHLESGVFAAALIDGLAGAAAEPDGRVRFSSLAQHVQRDVTRWRASAEGRAKLAVMTPVVRLEVSDLEVLPPIGYIALETGHAGPLGDPQLSNKIRWAAFSRDGRWLATAGEDATVRLWHPSTGKPGPGPMWHQGHVSGVAFAPDSLRLVSSCNDGQVRVWQAPGASLVVTMPPLQGRAHNVSWSPDGALVASVSDVGAHVYRAAGWWAEPHLVLQGHQGPVWSVAFSSTGLLATGGEDGTARIWDTARGALVRTVQVGGPVWAVAFSPDGKRLATAGADVEVGPELASVPRVREVRTGKLLFALRGHTRGVTAIAFDPEGRRIATSSYDGTARLWDARGGQPLAVFSAESAPEAYAATFSPDGRRLFVGFTDGRGRLFDV